MLQPHEGRRAEVMIRVWKDAIGYEGFYEISNLGNLRSVDRKLTAIAKNGSLYIRRLKGKEIGTQINTHGDKQANLSKDGVRKIFSIHTLVSEVFIPNLENKP
jgi:hypothetical protein